MALVGDDYVAEEDHQVDTASGVVDVKVGDLVVRESGSKFSVVPKADRDDNRDDNSVDKGPDKKVPFKKS